MFFIYLIYNKLAKELLDLSAKDVNVLLAKELPHTLTLLSRLVYKEHPLTFTIFGDDKRCLPIRFFSGYDGETGELRVFAVGYTPDAFTQHYPQMLNIDYTWLRIDARIPSGGFMTFMAFPSVAFPDKERWSNKQFIKEEGLLVYFFHEPLIKSEPC